MTSFLEILKDMNIQETNQSLEAMFDILKKYQKLKGLYLCTTLCVKNRDAANLKMDRVLITQVNVRAWLSPASFHSKSDVETKRR